MIASSRNRQSEVKHSVSAPSRLPREPHTVTHLLRPPEWTRQAACAGHPLGPAAWDNGTPAARRVCATCPVRLRCATDALHEALAHTMRGGLTPSDRTTIAATTGYDTPGLPRHGTRSRYGHRTHPCHCQLCRDAMSRWKRNYLAARAADTSRRRIAA